MDQRDQDKIVQLAREGLSISKIWADHFPQYDYWDIYNTIHENGEKSALGTKRAITNRLNHLMNEVSDDYVDTINEIKTLVDHLYDRYKDNQSKIGKIRKALD